jgi:asparagine synthase (glutamine-hydrolysing)
LSEAVRAQLRSVGGIGSHLSGGLDSGTTTALTAKTLAQDGKILHAFTAGPRRPEAFHPLVRATADETPQARRVAAHFPNIVHHIVFNDDRSMVEVNARYVAAMDETPLNPVNTVWMDAIHRQAQAKGITTILGGLIGNYTFSAGLHMTTPEFLRRRSLASYLIRLASLARAGEIPLRKAIHDGLRVKLPQNLFHAIKQRLSNAGPMPTGAVFLQEQAITDDDSPAEGKRRFQVSAGSDDDTDTLSRAFLMRQVDIGTLLKAGHGLNRIDLRDPTGDLRVVKFCLATPIELFSAGRRDRAFAKALYQRHISHDGLLNFIKGRQAADSVAVFLAERGRITEEITRATTRTPLFHATDPTPFFHALEQSNGTPLNPRDYHQTLSHLIRYSRLLGISQFLNYVDGGNA